MLHDARLIELAEARSRPCLALHPRQDPTDELLLQLALVQLVYNLGNIVGGTASGRTHHDSLQSSSHVEAVPDCEFFVMVLMLIIPLHK